MTAPHLKIVARNATAVPRDDCAPQRLDWPDPYTTQLSDEHLGHIWQLNGLGEFDREQWQKQCAYNRFKIAHKRAMDERDVIV